VVSEQRLALTDEAALAERHNRLAQRLLEG
jgi:hypothetical protein